MTRDHLFAGLTTTDVAGLDTERTLVVQPIGSIEQHGPHLPLMTDAHVAERLAVRAAEVGECDAVLVLPTLAYGKSNEHAGWPGTVTLSADTLLGICRDVGRSLAASGFTRMTFVNGHGGNPSLLDVAARDIRADTGLMVFPISAGRLGRPPGVDLPDEEFSIHGGHLETSLMLHLAPETVHMDRAEVGGEQLTDLFPTEGQLSLEGALPTAWLSDDLTVNGVLGDPRGAEAEVGCLVFEHWAARLSAAYRQMGEFRFRTA